MAEDWRAVPCRIGATRRLDRYRLTHRDGRVVYMHQQAWRDTHGPIPAGLFVCHECDVRACDEPRHLYLATNQQNMRDASARGRLVRSDATRARMCAAATGQHHSEATRALIAAHRTGIGHTPAARERIAAGLRRAYAEGRR